MSVAVLSSPLISESQNKDKNTLTPTSSFSTDSSVSSSSTDSSASPSLLNSTSTTASSSPLSSSFPSSSSPLPPRISLEIEALESRLRELKKIQQKEISLTNGNGNGHVSERKEGDESNGLVISVPLSHSSPNKHHDNNHNNFLSVTPNSAPNSTEKALRRLSRRSLRRSTTGESSSNTLNPSSSTRQSTMMRGSLYGLGAGTKIPSAQRTSKIQTIRQSQMLGGGVGIGGKYGGGSIMVANGNGAKTGGDNSPTKVESVSDIDTDDLYSTDDSIDDEDEEPKLNGNGRTLPSPASLAPPSTSPSRASAISTLSSRPPPFISYQNYDVSVHRQSDGTFLDVPSAVRHPDPKKNFYSWGEIRKHNHKGDCWLVVKGKVYDVTAFLPLHPAGPRSMIKHAAGDASVHFEFHSAKAQKIWASYEIGQVQREKEGKADCVIM